MLNSQLLTLLQQLTYVINTLLLLTITIGGYAHAEHVKRQERIAAKRESVEKACERIDMDFAMDLFAEVIFERKTLTAEDFKAVFYQFARSAEHHRRIRSRLRAFLETLRPALHVLGQHDGNCLRGPLDPIAFRLRLSLRAFSQFWNEQTRCFDSELDEHVKRELFEWLGGAQDWALLQASLTCVGLAPLAGPWDAVTPVMADAVRPLLANSDGLESGDRSGEPARIASVRCVQ